jgi:hypothetical protein
MLCMVVSGEKLAGRRQKFKKKFMHLRASAPGVGLEFSVTIYRSGGCECPCMDICVWAHTVAPSLCFEHQYRAVSSVVTDVSGRDN